MEYLQEFGLIWIVSRKRYKWTLTERDYNEPLAKKYIFFLVQSTSGQIGCWNLRADRDKINWKGLNPPSQEVYMLSQFPLAPRLSALFNDATEVVHILYSASLLSMKASKCVMTLKLPIDSFIVHCPSKIKVTNSIISLMMGELDRWIRSQTISQ